MGPVINVNNDPLITNPFNPIDNYSDKIDSQIEYLQAMKNRLAKTKQARSNNNSLWDKIDSEISSLNDEQRDILFNSKQYQEIDSELKFLVQQTLFNSVKDIIEQSEEGNKLLVEQLDFIKHNKKAIVSESNKKIELFEKFQIAAKANPNLTYKEFVESINQ